MESTNMTRDMPEVEWKEFFDDLSQRRFDWETKVEVIGNDIGDQVLDEGLPLGGITFEKKGDDNLIEIFLGNDDDHHQTHTIVNPTRVAFMEATNGQGGIVEFEQADETKTLLYIIRPMPVTASSAEKDAAA
ncbi:MAG: DUF5335 family protein [Pyrinomonadaceae bacterium]